MSKKYTAVGSYAGIGSMLIPFKNRKNWAVLGNHENRKIHTYVGEDGKNTFTEYFQSPLWPNGVPPGIHSTTLMAAQPKCGGFSSLYATGRRAGDSTSGVEKYGEMILESIQDIVTVQPEVFYMDNLAKSLLLITPKMWDKYLKNYHIYFHWVSNYHYGNAQKGRNRLFVVGSRNGFHFVPRENKPGKTVKDCIGDLLDAEWGSVPNHDKHSRNDTDNICNLAKSNKWKHIAKYVKEECRYGENLPYRAQDGTIKRRIGSNKLHWDKHSHTLAGIKGAKFHPVHGYPISIRERCRLQGYPDDFVIQGTKYMPDGTWSLRKNSYPVRQLNNTMPLEFCEEFATQLCYFLKYGKNQYSRSEAIHGIKPNPIIDAANAEMEKRRSKRNGS